MRVDGQVCRQSEAAGRSGGRAETSLHYKAKSSIRQRARTVNLTIVRRKQSGVPRETCWGCPQGLGRGAIPCRKPGRSQQRA